MLPAAARGRAWARPASSIFYLALSYGPGLDRGAGARVERRASRSSTASCTGERPSALQLAGLALTLAGVILVSWSDGDGHTRGRRGIGFGVLAALLLGTLLVFFSRASAVDPYWAPFVLRAMSLSRSGRSSWCGAASRVDRRGLPGSRASACSTCSRTSPTGLDHAAVALDHGRAELALPGRHGRARAASTSASA